MIAIKRAIYGVHNEILGRGCSKWYSNILRWWWIYNIIKMIINILSICRSCNRACLWWCWKCI